jgi:hypothetical protein
MLAVCGHRLKFPFVLSVATKSQSRSTPKAGDPFPVHAERRDEVAESKHPKGRRSLDSVADATTLSRNSFANDFKSKI